MDEKSDDEARVASFAAETMLDFLTELVAEFEGVRRAEDIECVHRMRVASRRVRTALNLFADCFPAKRVAQWQEQIKGITKALGAARDTDVQLEVLHELLAEAPEQRYLPGIRRVILRLEQRRKRLQVRLIAALDRLEERKTLPEMEGALRQQRIHAQLHQVSGTPPQLYRRAQATLIAQLEVMLGYELYLDKPERMLELHAMRIAAKHLRYSLQIYGPIYDGELKEFFTVVRKLQDILGEIHDCDVWAGWLPIFAEEELQRVRQYYGHTRTFAPLRPGLTWLAENRAASRNKHHAKLNEYWQEIEEQQLWSRMLVVLGKRINNVDVESE
ncbi:MAG: CHAD domain-containing protein [bacterium]